MLSITSEHALRALTCLARLPEGASMSGRELAEEARIPANYLAKILWTLGTAGIIHATRGSGGGYRLKRNTGELYLFEIVGLFERQRDSSPDDPCRALAQPARHLYRLLAPNDPGRHIPPAGGSQ